MNNNTGPDILGICEIENRPIVEKLVSSLANLSNHDYKIIHADTQDERGLMLLSFMMAKSSILKRIHKLERNWFSHTLS